MDSGRRQPETTEPSDGELPIAGEPASPYFSTSRSTPTTTTAPPPEPQEVARGVVVFDVDGTLLDDLRWISDVAGDVMHRAFGTAPDEGRVHYLATTGLPFEAQLAQLYPEAPRALREGTARIFHQRKVTEAYAHAEPFPDVPKMLHRLSTEGWTLVVSTGAETEMAELLLEREGLRFWFESVLGSRDGTKREHLIEYRRRYPNARMFLVGDSRFDMEAVQAVPGVTALGRASSFLGWTLTPEDLRKWGAAWADYSLAELPEVLVRWERRTPPATRPGRSAAQKRVRKPSRPGRSQRAAPARQRRR